VFGLTAYAEAPFASLAGATFLVTVSESANAADLLSALATFPASITEEADGSASFSSTIVFITNVNESATASDAISAETLIDSKCFRVCHRSSTGICNC
jgi:hypothetical protein